MLNLWDWLKFCEEEYRERSPLMEAFPIEDKHRLKRVLDLFGGPSIFEGKRILEIGSQDGLFSMIMRSLGAEVTAIDMISKWIRYGYDHDQVGVNWLICFAEYLPIRNHVFDMIFLGEILEHVLDPEQVLQEALRVSRPGSRWVVTVPWVAMKEPTHVNEWPSFKWRALISKYLEIEASEIFRERWFIVVGTTTNTPVTITVKG